MNLKCAIKLFNYKYYLFIYGNFAIKQSYFHWITFSLNRFQLCWPSICCYSVDTFPNNHRVLACIHWSKSAIHLWTVHSYYVMNSMALNWKCDLFLSLSLGKCLNSMALIADDIQSLYATRHKIHMGRFSNNLKKRKEIEVKTVSLY